MTTPPGQDLEAAVREAYTPQGQDIWWRAWVAADPAKRRGMERGVMLEWSGGG